MTKHGLHNYALIFGLSLTRAYSSSRTAKVFPYDAAYTGTNPGRNATVTSMPAIFYQIGSANLFTHSASGMTVWQTAIANEKASNIAAY
jgi:hypothetical protein